MTRHILERAHTIAVVGLSTSPFKDAHRIPAAMRGLGYRVVGVPPSAGRLLGAPAYRSLLDIPDGVDIVNVFRPAREAPDIAAQAAAIGASALWLQQGIRSPEAARIARGAGMDYVEDRCIAVDAMMYGVRRTA